MSNMREPVLKAVADVVREHVGKAFTSLRGRIDGLEQQIKSLPKPERGEKGETGQEGIRGDIGPAGKDGANGKDGERGLDGVNGAIGPEGKQGPSGLNGAAGKDGKDGLTVKGEPGKDAPAVDEDALAAKILGKIPVPKDGAAGPIGMTGKNAPPIDEDALAAKILAKIPVPSNGLPGKDAPAVDIEALSASITQKVLGLIPVPKDGRDGNDGESPDANDIVKAVLAQIPPPIPGKDAPAVDTKALGDQIVEKVLGLLPEPKHGKDGTSVDPEAIRILIAGEVTKAVAALPKPAAGRDGRDGRAGDTGPAGQDAADFDILNGMDESASYQRGQFVKHRNGLFRAYRTTDPVVDKNFEAAGWMCINASVVDIVETLAPDKRTVIKAHEFSDGSLITTEYKTPTVIYRGVFKEGHYEAGDAVTSAGALWIANVVTSQKPGLSKDWTLAVKRGSDGKDLRPKDDDDRPANGVHLGLRR